MKKILLDTSIIIDFVRRDNKKDTILFQLSQTGYELYASIITHTEVYSGKSVWAKSLAQEEIEKVFVGVAILPLEIKVSKKAGEIKAHYDATLVDAIIAATAVENKLELVTLNVKDFKNIKGLELADYPKMTLEN